MAMPQILGYLPCFAEVASEPHLHFVFTRWDGLRLPNGEQGVGGQPATPPRVGD